MTSLADGDYAGACGMLGAPVQAVMIRRLLPRATCERVFKRCLPNDVVRLRSDQSQLFYASMRERVHGRDAVVQLSGTAVGDALRMISLISVQGSWRLASYGEALTGCRRGRRRALSHGPRARQGRTHAG